MIAAKSAHINKKISENGSMESNQRRLTSRLKCREMYWSEARAQAVTEVQQDITNGTLGVDLVSVRPTVG